MKSKKRGSRILTYFVIIILILVVLNLALLATKDKVEEEKEKPSLIIENGKVIVSMKLPAVDEEGKGVSTLLTVEASEGQGRTLTDIDNLLFWADTQHSIRIAKLVASDISEKNLDKVDLIYSIEANASVIGGPSAGAALAIATLAAIEGKEINPDVMITGSINHDGSLGPVSAVLEKAKAAKEAGANLFLVPLLQSGDVIYETEEHCEVFGLTEICATETKPRKVDVNEEVGLELVEVGNVRDALDYFFD